MQQVTDVLGALPPALGRLGWSATIVLPRYRGVSAGHLIETFPVSIGGFTRDGRGYVTVSEGVHPPLHRFVAP